MIIQTNRVVALALAAGLGLTLAGAQCPLRRQDSVAVPARAEEAVLPDSTEMVIYSGRIVLTEQSVTQGVLLADTIYVYDNGTRFELRQVHVTFYTEQGAEEGVLTARQGSYNQRLQRLEARGDVVVLAEDGRRLDTPQLVYDQARNQIFSDSTFVLNRPPQQISGIGFESDPQLTVFRVHRNAKFIGPVKIPTQ